MGRHHSSSGPSTVCVKYFVQPCLFKHLQSHLVSERLAQVLRKQSQVANMATLTTRFISWQLRIQVLDMQKVA